MAIFDENGGSDHLNLSGIVGAMPYQRKPDVVLSSYRLQARNIQKLSGQLQRGIEPWRSNICINERGPIFMPVSATKTLETWKCAKCGELSTADTTADRHFLFHVD